MHEAYEIKSAHALPKQRIRKKLIISEFSEWDGPFKKQLTLTFKNPHTPQARVGGFSNLPTFHNLIHLLSYKLAMYTDY